MDIIISKLMKNIKINYKEENSDIIFEDYYFNGFPKIKDLEIKNITSSSF